MQKILISQPKDTISVDDICCAAIVAYKSKDGKNYCILKKLTKGTRENLYKESWGFIPISGGDDTARYISGSWRESINLVNGNRTLFYFESGTKLIDAIYHKKF